MIGTDQGTKWLAWRHIDGALINDGGYILLGPTVRSWFAAPATGAAANLLDRFGLHDWTAPGSGRGVVDFIPSGGASRCNVADLWIAAGAVMIAAVARAPSIPPTYRGTVTVDPVAPPPDDEDWTWVLEEQCADCGFDARAIRRGDIGPLVMTSAETLPAAARRPLPTQRPRSRQSTVLAGTAPAVAPTDPRSRRTRWAGTSPTTWCSTHTTFGAEPPPVPPHGANAGRMRTVLITLSPAKPGHP